MIANIVVGKSFRPTLLYHLIKVENKTAEWLDSSFIYQDEKNICREINFVRLLRPNLNMFFYHISLNFPPWEEPENDLMKQIAQNYLEKMGFDQHQYAIFKHKDTEHPHLHILANRIGYDGSLVPNYNDYLRSEQVLRQLEETYKLTKVISSSEAQERSMTKNELEMMMRTDEPTIKLKLQLIIKDILRKKPSASEFIQSLEAQEIHVSFHLDGEDSIGYISYRYKDMPFKGARLGKAYKWTYLKNEIDYEQERDRTAIHEANLRAEANRSQQSADAAKTGIGASPKSATGNLPAVRQGIGTFQEQIERAYRSNDTKAGTIGKDDEQYRPTTTKDGQQRGTNLQDQQQNRQPVGNPTLPDRNLIRDLRCTDPNTDNPDKSALNGKTRRNKKRGLKL